MANCARDTLLFSDLVLQLPIDTASALLELVLLLKRNVRCHHHHYRVTVLSCKPLSSSLKTPFISSPPFLPTLFSSHPPPLDSSSSFLLPLSRPRTPSPTVVSPNHIVSQNRPPSHPPLHHFFTTPSVPPFSSIVASPHVGRGLCSRWR